MLTQMSLEAHQLIKPSQQHYLVHLLPQFLKYVKIPIKTDSILIFQSKSLINCRSLKRLKEWVKRIVKV